MADIAINPVTRRVQFTGNTGTGPFAFTFNILTDADIAVYKNTTLLTLASDYTIATNANGTGSVTLQSGQALISSDVLTIIGGRNLERTTDFVTAGDLLASSLNEQLDSLVIMTQQLDEKLSRSVKVNPGDVFTDLEMPLKDARKGTVLGFNATTGDPEPGPTIADVSTLTAITADISTLADIEDGTDATDAIQTVAGISSNVTTVAGVSTNVTTVAGISANVTTVAGISANVTTVAGDQADIGTVASNISDVNTAASNITDIQNASTNAATATTKASEAATSATNAATSETNAGNSATASASSASAAATSETNAANSAAAAAAAFDNFDDTYLGSKTSDPTVDNDGNALVSGALYFNSTANEMRVYDGANWIAASSAGTASLILYEYTATSGQTTFSGADDNSASLSYSVGNIQVVMNGIVLDPSDFTATSGTSVVLASGAATGDLVNIYAFKSFTVADTVSASAGGTFAGNVAMTGNLTVDTDTLHVDSANNRVGVGTSSPTEALTVTGGNIQVDASSRKIGFKLSGNSNAGYLIPYDGSGNTQLVNERSGGNLIFKSANTERMRLDSSGNLLVGQSSTALPGDGNTTTGISISGQYDLIAASRSSGVALKLNRNSDGDIATFSKDGTTVGIIGSVGGTPFFANASTGGIRLGTLSGALVLMPCSETGALEDNQHDVGHASTRWDDIYATNGTIQTSDANEKQDIAELSEAEQRVAVAAKGLLRKFRWKDAVAEKGDEARTHFGIIAQDLQAAFAAEGLDAGDYAMFISTTWWEHDVEVPAVEAVAEVLDDDGNVVTEAVEAKDAYTRTDTYDTQEEAPEGATERTRLGVRYSELLAFIIGAL